jgi:hypothetical protein
VICPWFRSWHFLTMDGNARFPAALPGRADIVEPTGGVRIAQNPTPLSPDLCCSPARMPPVVSMLRWHIWLWMRYCAPDGPQVRLRAGGGFSRGRLFAF